ncbi:hypothetical protein [Vibrio gigantis]|uniref:Uncharacterized protein n=1 Tax=Vibrio gigantis TaxID=296199 RepID=A0A5M9P3M8_9VIBR|nr:hypothetical protein [Vibrio gigantis]KAA8679664.1 hypothetical protein F4W18_05410 [Vibrio gigantis]
MNRYEGNVINQGLLPSFNLMVSRETGLEQQRISTFFTPAFIKSLVLCNADELYEKIVTIYDNFHELSERYCLEYYLKDIRLDSSIASMPIQKNTDKDLIRIIHEQTLAELKALSEERQSIYLPVIINNMEGTTVASEIKRQLKLLNSMKAGNHTLSDEIKALFPVWVNEISNIFDYSSMSRSFGHEITHSLNFDVCPYCNNEDIETIDVEGAETRPDLDHFYPQSKFPFLALTLSNLIPSGYRCNRTYKSANSMFGYVHPYITGVGQNTIFDFNYMFDEGRTASAINIKVNKLNDNLDKNLGLFKVEVNHNKRNVKDWFLLLEERYQMLVNSDNDCLDEVLNDDNLIRQRLDIDLNKSPTTVLFQKLKIDALNYLSGREYEISD